MLIQQLGGRYEPLEIENARLRKELEDAKQQISALAQANGADTRKALEEIKSRYEDLKRQYTSLENRSAKEHASQEGKVDELGTVIRDLQSKLTSQERTISSLKERKNALAEESKARIQSFKSSIAEKDAQIHTLKGDLKKVQSRVSPAKSRFSLGSGIGGTVLGAVLAGVIFLLVQGGNTVGEPPFSAGAQETSTDITSLIPDSVQRQIIRDGIDFMYVPPGEFMMGSENGDDDERPLHKVEITEGFYLGKMEVTQAQWENVMGEDSPSSYKGGNQPVENVTWNEVQVFIERLNDQAGCTDCYRLPTEAEWEYAARAGTTTAYSFGDNERDLEEYAWYDGSGGPKPVGQKKPNALGLHDMHGNVWEWVEDRYAGDYYGQFQNQTAIDPLGPENGSYRVFRGGSWNYGAGGLRSAIRGSHGPGGASYDLGFRLLRTHP